MFSLRYSLGHLQYSRLLVYLFGLRDPFRAIALHKDSEIGL